MKLIPSLLFTLLMISSFASEKPEEIPLKTKMIRPAEWYASQAVLWKQALKEKPSREAWINYYLGSRYGQLSKEQLNEIARTVMLESPGSFEANLIQGLDLGYQQQAIDFIGKAYSIDALHPATYAPLVLLNEFHLDEEERKTFSKLLWQSDQVSPSLLSYSYNVLMSLEQNGILFTEGDNTTLPIFILQDVFNIRTDVQVLNLDVMLDASYRERKLKLANLDLNNFVAVANESDDKRNLCGLLPVQNPTQKFYYSLSIAKQNTADIRDQLYIVGLASQISKQRLDNISHLKENLENRFLLDHLTVDFDGESSYAAGKVLGANYLVPMLLLAEHYQQTGQSEKLLKWQTLITKLAEEHNKSLVVQNFLNRQKNTPAPFVPSGLNVKALEGSFKPVKDNIYALKNELTIDDYTFFLNYLQKNNMQEIYDRAKFDLSQYTEPALSFMKGYHATIVTKIQKHAYPIVNIPYEGAVAYCDWLTEQYNNDPKRKYKKVVFRLPAINEWQVAALGYKKIKTWNLDENSVEMVVPKNSQDEICKNCPTKLYPLKNSDILYPWFQHYNLRSKALNKFGCALGNFKWPDSVKGCRPGIPSPDGFSMMAFVEAYFPNGMGLWDVVGNVAEMTNEKGKACGGSWNHTPEESTIRSINEYKGPDAAVGFRPFMEVIEQ
jgi:hypothetical protein